MFYPLRVKNSKNKIAHNIIFTRSSNGSTDCVNGFNRIGSKRIGL